MAAPLSYWRRVISNARSAAGRSFLLHALDERRAIERKRRRAPSCTSLTTWRRGLRLLERLRVVVRFGFPNLSLLLIEDGDGRGEAEAQRRGLDGDVAAVPRLRVLHRRRDVGEALAARAARWPPRRSPAGTPARAGRGDGRRRGAQELRLVRRSAELAEQLEVERARSSTEKAGTGPADAERGTRAPPSPAGRLCSRLLDRLIGFQLLRLDPRKVAVVDGAALAPHLEELERLYVGRLVLPGEREGALRLRAT